MSDGSVFTLPAANSLQEHLAGQPFDVLYDHGDKAISKDVGKIVVWGGTHYVEPRRPKQFAQLDIAILSKNSERAHLLVEIEDGSDRPKTVLGDALATLVGSGVLFGNGRTFELGGWTTFIVCVFIKNNRHRAEHIARLKLLESTVRRLAPNLGTPNSVIGDLLIEGFSDQQELNLHLHRRIEQLHSNK